MTINKGRILQLRKSEYSFKSSQGSLNKERREKKKLLVYNIHKNYILQSLKKKIICLKASKSAELVTMIKSA